jgi:hypothetical protein
MRLRLACRTSIAAEVMDQAGIKVLSRRGAASAAGAEPDRHVLHKAAALHDLRTGEDVTNAGARNVEAVKQILQMEAQGTSACGECKGCIDGGGCKRAADREASRRGKLGAIWAEEAGQLVGRGFEVCTLRSMPDIE